VKSLNEGARYRIEHSILLMIRIIKTALPCFSDEMGWPLALMLSGLMLIVEDNLALRLNRGYLSRKSGETG
jgi:hypothetical protein